MKVCRVETGQDDFRNRPCFLLRYLQGEPEHVWLTSSYSRGLDSKEPLK